MALTEATSEQSARRDPGAVKAVVAALAAKFGNRLVTSQAVREQHANTTTWIANEPPDAVVFPQSTEDVQDIVRICAAHRVPVIPFGTGTSLEGHVNAPHGGVSIDVRDMNRVLAVNARTSIAWSSPASRASSSTSICATRACSSRSTPAPTPRSAAWRRRAAPAPTRCATAP